MFLFDEMVSCSEGDEMSVVGRGGYGDRPGATDVSVTQLVSQSLQLVSRKSVVVPKHVIMRRPRRSLK